MTLDPPPCTGYTGDMEKEFRSGNPKDPLKFNGIETKIEAVPKGCNFVRIGGYSTQAGSRTAGLSLITFAESMGAFSPANIDTPEEKEFSMSLLVPRTGEENQKLLEFLNTRLAEGCSIEFSNKEL